MAIIRKATIKDISRIAEILVFTKRMNYRCIFHDDQVSFGEMQVLPTAKEYEDNPHSLDTYWVYEDGFVKGLINIDEGEIKELYVDDFFHSEGIGSKLIDFAIKEHSVKYLWVLEKNEKAIGFYKKHGFSMSKERQLEEGTIEYIVKMER